MSRMDKNGELLTHSRELRKNMTKEERRLWYDFLKPLPVVFKRQKIIGSYIVDFYCPGRKLVIELDGSQHYLDDGAEYDKIRDAALNSRGLQVLRYSNADVNTRFSGVCEDILKHLGLEL